MNNSASNKPKMINSNKIESVLKRIEMASLHQHFISVEMQQGDHLSYYQPTIADLNFWKSVQEDAEAEYRNLKANL